MAGDLRMALLELLRKAKMDEELDFLQEGVRSTSQVLMEVEVSQHLGAERYQRAAERTGQRNGYRDRPWDTRVGTLELKCRVCGTGATFRSQPVVRGISFLVV